MKRSLVAVVALVAAALVCVGSADARSSISNGGFESGKFGSWWTFNVNKNSRWIVNSGGEPFLDPYEGNFAAGAVQFGPSAQVLYQQFKLKRGQTQLSFALYWNEDFCGVGAPTRVGCITAPEKAPSPEICGPFAPSPSDGCGEGFFCTPASIDLSECNQQFRVDLLRDGSSPVSFRSKDILETLFVTEDGAPAFEPWFTRTFDLSEFTGKSVTLRFLVTTTEGPLVAGVDAVSLSEGKD